MTPILHLASTSPEGDADAWRGRDHAVVSTAYGRYSDLVIERADGPWLFTVDGRRVLDLTCGIGVVNLGHNHPAVVAAVHAQVDRLWHTSVTALNPAMIAAAEALARVAPRGLDRVFLGNSGAEAVEGAIKLARKATGRTDVIAFEGGFHGRTYGALTLTASKARYHAGMGPLLPGVHHVAYPSGSSSDATFAQLDDLFHSRVDPSDVAAIVVEPVLGEGGYVVPSPDFLPRLRTLCDEHGILLVLDEVQSGFARTGRMFASEHTATIPDVMTVAKGFGNGLPIGAFVAPRSIMEALQPGDHGTTFGGNPVASSAALAVIETIERDQLCARAERLGASVMARLRTWQEWAPEVNEVRGLGLMIGIEFTTAEGAAATALVHRLRAAALERDVLLLHCGRGENVIRLVPPLTIEEADLDAGLDVMEAALREARR